MSTTHYCGIEAVLPQPYDYVINNIAESFNNWIKDMKDMYVYELVDKLREKIMELFHRRCQIGWMFEGKSPIVYLTRVESKN
jgi:hypothetical protein